MTQSLLEPEPLIAAECVDEFIFAYVADGARYSATWPQKVVVPQLLIASLAKAQLACMTTPCEPTILQCDQSDRWMDASELTSGAWWQQREHILIGKNAQHNIGLCVAGVA